MFLSKTQINETGRSSMPTHVNVLAQNTPTSFNDRDSLVSGSSIKPEYKHSLRASGLKWKLNHIFSRSEEIGRKPTLTLHIPEEQTIQEGLINLGSVSSSSTKESVGMNSSRESSTAVYLNRSSLADNIVRPSLQSLTNNQITRMPAELQTLSKEPLFSLPKASNNVPNSHNNFSAFSESHTLIGKEFFIVAKVKFALAISYFKTLMTVDKLPAHLDETKEKVLLLLFFNLNLILHRRDQRAAQDLTQFLTDSLQKVKSEFISQYHPGVSDSNETIMLRDAYANQLAKDFIGHACQAFKQWKSHP